MPKGHPAFWRGCGLCGAVDAWRRNGETELNFELKMQFLAKGLNHVYPFNENSRAYEIESYHDMCHLNEKRIQWVFNHAKIARLVKNNSCNTL